MILVLGVWAFVRALLVNSAAVSLENVALRHQLSVLQRSCGRPRLRRRDRIFWVCLSRLWANWRASLILVHPAFGSPAQTRFVTGTGSRVASALPSASAVPHRRWPPKSSGRPSSRSRQDCVEIAIAVVFPHWTGVYAGTLEWPIGG